jgi:hypothetical protein
MEDRKMTDERTEIKTKLEQELDEFGKKLEELLVKYRMEKISIVDGALVFSKTVDDAVGTVSVSWNAPKDKEE